MIEGNDLYPVPKRWKRLKPGGVGRQFIEVPPPKGSLYEITGEALTTLLTEAGFIPDSNNTLIEKSSRKD